MQDIILKLFVIIGLQYNNINVTRKECALPIFPSMYSIIRSVQTREQSLLTCK